MILIYLTERFHVAMHLFSCRSQMTAKYDKNKQVALKPQCATDVFTTQMHVVLNKTKKIIFSFTSPACLYLN